MTAHGIFYGPGPPWDLPTGSTGSATVVFFKPTPSHIGGPCAGSFLQAIVGYFLGTPGTLGYANPCTLYIYNVFMDMSQMYVPLKHCNHAMSVILYHLWCPITI